MVIPARDEQELIEPTVRRIVSALREAAVDFEVLIVLDDEADPTGAIVQAISRRDPRVRLLFAGEQRGFGRAVRAGLSAMTGDAVAVVMGDGSDDPADLVTYLAKLEEGWDCVFGSRFCGGYRLERYPRRKLVMNRMANNLIRVLFRHGLDDTTNGFKAYRRAVIEDVDPLVSRGFEISPELALKAIVRGYRVAVVPVSYSDRTAGRSKFRLRGGGRYVLVVAYVLCERLLGVDPRRSA